MISKLKSPKTQVYLASAFLPMLLMAIAWYFMGAFPFGDKTLMAVDFGQQYIGLYAFLKEVVLTGDWSGLFYSFSKSIGGAMVGIWGFNLISPFNLIYVFLPLSQFKWAIFLTIWLRYGATGLAFAHLLVKRYGGLTKPKVLVPLMATAYALSGMIVSYQMNPIFYDAMIMLPLVIVALEEFIDGAKPYKYMALLAASMVLHFYMGFMICVFVALYTFFYLSGDLARKEWKTANLKVGKVVAASVVGILATAVLLYPIFLNLLRSKGAYESYMTFAWSLQINPLDILSKLMVGAFDNESWPAGPNLPNIYVGAFALFGFVAYFLSEKIERHRKIAGFLISFFFIVSFAHEFTNKIWHMGQTPAGFFYRFSWIASFFMVLLAYQAISKGLERDKVNFFAVGIVAAGAIGYVGAKIKDFSFLTWEQPFQVTTWVSEHKTGTFFWLGGLLAFTGLYIWKRLNWSRPIKIGVTVGLVASFYPLMSGLQHGWLLSQVPITVITWVVAITVIFFKPKKLGYGLVLFLTMFEMSYNAYLSQVRIGYDNAPQFTDASESMAEIVREMKKHDGTSEFYRAATTFYYAKNDPFTADFNGLSNFSSNMEKSTIDLFNSLGDVGGNAATFYANGTQMTDMLYGIRYFIVAKPYTNEDLTNNPGRHYFSEITNRKDMGRYFVKVFENDRYELHRRNVKSSIGFGINDVTASIKFGTNNPVANQNIVLNTMAGDEYKYFETFAFDNVVLDNLEKVDDGTGRDLYRRIDKTRQGTITYTAIPQTDNTYYVVAPYQLRESKGTIDVMLDDQWYKYTQSYDQMQLWQMTSNTKGQAFTFKIGTTDSMTSDELDLTGLTLVKADNNMIDQVIGGRLAQSMNTTDWGNNWINGDITITDDSTKVLTSVAYNPGWKVKVDGKEVKTEETWGALLAFPITKGTHKIEMVFIPDGFYEGLAVSAVTIVGVLCVYLWKGKRDE